MKDELDIFVSQLVSNFPGISSIWLFGSRANKTAKAFSDWDVLVFGDEETFINLKKNEFFHRGAVDLLVVTDGDNFKKPYGEAKSGSLSEWKWKETGSNEAEYISVKFVPDEAGGNLGEIDKKILKSTLLYRKPNNDS